MTRSTFKRNVKNVADEIYSPNYFELLNSETMGNDQNNQSLDKNISVFCNTSIKKTRRSKQVLRKPTKLSGGKCAVPGDKTYKEALLTG